MICCSNMSRANGLTINISFVKTYLYQIVPSKSFMFESADAVDMTDALSLNTESLSSDPLGPTLPKRRKGIWIELCRQQVSIYSLNKQLNLFLLSTALDLVFIYGLAE